MVIMFRKCEANTILVLLTKFVPLSLNMQVALANGQYKVTFTSFKLLFYWCVMENIIEYCSMYYGTHHGRLKCMFADPTYLQLDDGASDDVNCN